MHVNASRMPASVGIWALSRRCAPGLKDCGLCYHLRETPTPLWPPSINLPTCTHSHLHPFTPTHPPAPTHTDTIKSFRVVRILHAGMLVVRHIYIRHITFTMSSLQLMAHRLDLSPRRPNRVHHHHHPHTHTTTITTTHANTHTHTLLVIYYLRIVCLFATSKDNTIHVSRSISGYGHRSLWRFAQVGMSLGFMFR